jgi:hypothetical protein
MFPKIVLVAAELVPLVRELLSACKGKDPAAVRRHLALAAVEAKRLPVKELRGG